MWYVGACADVGSSRYARGSSRYGSSSVYGGDETGSGGSGFMVVDESVEEGEVCGVGEGVGVVLRGDWGESW